VQYDGNAASSPCTLTEQGVGEIDRDAPNQRAKQGETATLGVTQVSHAGHGDGPTERGG
jgi:hypothetical protein